MKLKGKELQKIINGSGIKIAEIVDKSGIKAPTLYSLYKKDEIEDHYLEKLQAAGIKLQKTTNNPNDMDGLIQTIKQALDIANKSNQSLLQNTEFLQTELRQANAVIHDYIRGIDPKKTSSKAV